MATKREYKKQSNIQVRNSYKRNVLETDDEGISCLREKIKRKNSAEELITDIISEIEAPPLYYKHANEICNNLNQIMNFFYKNPRVKIELFGSSVTKLALRGSDVDIYLDFGGIWSVTENLPEPPQKLVQTLKNKVRKYGYFIRTIPIFARVPIVRCVHRTNVSCDLSFLNALGVKNSHLIKFLLSIDNRIRPLILILKFSMKTQGLLGQQTFTSFALISLVLFFLQVLENPIIPSIYYLQSLATKRKIVADWDTSFTTEMSLLPPVKNQLSVLELLQKFFEFYSTFEFGFYVISLFIAKTKLKPVFSDLNFLPEEFRLHKANLTKNKSFEFDCNKFMCVQDPFNHGNNITRTVTQRSLVDFQKFCSDYAVMGDELLNKNTSEESKMKFLISLFNQKMETKSKKIKKEEIIIFVGEKLTFDNSDCTEDDLRNKWSEHIFNEVQKILCKVLKCDIDVQSNVSENESTGFFSDEKVIRCELHYVELATKKRNELKSDFEFFENISVIEKEEIISDYLCDTLLKNANKVSLKFEISCVVKKKPTCFCMNLDSKELQKRNSHLVRQVFQFLQNHFPKWIK